MSRLALPRRPKTGERDQCLPAGDGLPLWSTLPLDAKFPMVPNKPKGSVVLCTTKLGEPKHKRQLESDFDLSDPWGHVLSNEYLPLHDPHLKELFNSPRMRRHLVRKQFITGDGKVICNLKDFNQYRRYLRRICLMEIARERMLKDDEEKMMREELMNAVKVEMKTTDARLNKVRKRLMDIRENTRKNLEIAIQSKADRLKKRIDDIEMAKSVKDVKRQEEDRRKQAALYEHRQELRRRNVTMMRQWKLKQRHHAERIEEQRQQRIQDQERKSREMWETRKRIQQQRMEEEAITLKEEQKKREKSITNREKIFNEQIERMRAKLDQLKEQARREHEEREKSHADRLSKRLAACEYRAWARQRARRGLTRPGLYKSLWSLEDTIRRFIIPDILPDIVLDDFKSSTSFLRMLNEAIDQTVDIVVQTVEDDDDFEIHEHANQIVNSVLQNVCYGGLPGSGEAALASKSVRFTEEELVISTSATSGDAFSDLKPVSAHQLTPGPSPYDIPTTADIKDQTEIKIVENLLTRLLEDLNSGRLTHDDLIRLSTHCVEILGNFDKVRNKSVEGIPCRATDDSDAAEDLVKFTVCRILDDIKSGAISSGDLTDLTLSIINASKRNEDDISTDGIEQFIDETICSIVKDGDGGEESPINECMLEDFVVNTIQTVADDVAQGRLSKNMISNMVALISREIDLYSPESDLEGILKRILEDLDSDKSEILYRVVHTTISCYYSYKESAIESLSNLVRDIMSRLNSVIELGGITDSEIDLRPLNQVATNLSSVSLSTIKMNQLISDISVALNEKSQLHLSKNTFEDVIKDVRSKIEQANSSVLQKIASIVTESCKNIVEGSQVQDTSSDQQNEIDSNLQKISHFVIKVLKIVKKYLDDGEFSQADIKEMTCIMFEMGSEMIEMPEPYNRPEAALNQYIKTLLTEIENGNIASDDIKQLGNDLIAFGQRIVNASLSRTTSETVSSRPSFTSTAVAEDFVTHMISSMEADLSRGVMSSESLKELAVCILKPTISREDAAIHKSVEEGLDSSFKHPSPCESQLAHVVAGSTIESILKDLEEGTLPPATICSIGTSVTAHLSREDQEFKPAITKIVDSLKADNIDQQQAQHIFSIILQHYKTYTDTSKDVKHFFNRRTSAASSSQHAESYISETLHNIEKVLADESETDSVLAESLIKQTLLKIKRDIQSGNISDDELTTLVDSKSAGGYTSPIDKTSEEIINFVLAILHESLVSIGTGEMSTEALMDFLSMIDAETFRPKQDYTIDEIRRNLRNIIRNIKNKGTDSAFLQNIITTYAGREARIKCGETAETWKPMQTLHRLLQTIEPNVLTHFVRITLQSVLRDVTQKKKSKSTGEKSTQDADVPDYLLQSTSSIVANNVVRNLMCKIECILISGDSLRTDLDLSAFRMKSSSSEVLKQDAWDDQLISAPSKHVGDIILQTLNNIVSNLRLERSISQMGIDSKDRLQQRTSSELVDDFILQKLQEIIESMQDSLLFDFKEREEQSYAEESVNTEKSTLLPMTDKGGTSFVTAVLRDVVKELAEDGSDKKETTDKKTSTLSIEAENIVIGALQNIVDQFCFPGSDELFDPDDADIKVYILNVLENIKRSISSSGTGDENVKSAVTKIFKGTDSVKDSADVKSEPSDFLESTLDFIIENIKDDKLKASDIYNSGIVSSSESGDIFDDLESENNLGRPCLNLQKMSEMTNKMLKLHDDLQKVSKTKCDDESVSKIQKQSSVRCSVTDTTQEIINETIKQTINNLAEGKVSNDEAFALASALGCETGVDMTKGNSDGFEESVVTEYITDMLQYILEKLNKTGINSSVVKQVTDCLAKSKSNLPEHRNEGGDSCSSLSSATSDILTDAVKNLIGTIRKQLSDEHQNSLSNLDADVFKSSRPSTPNKFQSAHSTSSVTSEASNTVSETSSKGNVNPNAVIKRKPNKYTIPRKSNSKTTVESCKSDGKRNLKKRERYVHKSLNERLPPSGARRNSVESVTMKHNVRPDHCISKVKIVDDTLSYQNSTINRNSGNKTTFTPTTTTNNIQRCQPKPSSTTISNKPDQYKSKINNTYTNEKTTQSVTITQTIKSKPRNSSTLHKGPFFKVACSDTLIPHNDWIKSRSNWISTSRSGKNKSQLYDKCIPPGGTSKTRSTSVQEHNRGEMINSKSENRRSISTIGGPKSTTTLHQSKKIMTRNRKRSAKLDNKHQCEDKHYEIQKKTCGEERSGNLLHVSSLCGSHKSIVKIRTVNEEEDK